MYSYKFNNHIELQYHSIDDTILNDMVLVIFRALVSKSSLASSPLM